MELTTQVVQQFVGGQIQVQNQIEDYIYRGEIATATVENNELKVTCSWLAKGVKTFPTIECWVKDNKLDYVASLEIYSVRDVGPGKKGGNRLCLQSAIVGEIVLLFPPDGSKLDRTKVQGLEPILT